MAEETNPQSAPEQEAPQAAETPQPQEPLHLLQTMQKTF